jgi:hypothetical protein
VQQRHRPLEGRAAAAAEAVARLRPQGLSLGFATGAVVIGGLLSLLSCFLPLARAGRETLSLVPGVTSHVGGAAMVPLACLAIAGLGATMSRAGSRARAIMCGVSIGLASPGVIFAWLFVRAAAALSSGLDVFGVDARASVGAVLLLIGFLAALIGSFAVLSRGSAPERSALNGDAMPAL